MAKSLEKVGNSWEKWQKVEKCRKVARCGYMWFYVAKSGCMWLKVAKVILFGSKYVLPKR